MAEVIALPEHVTDEALDAHFASLDAAEKELDQQLKESAAKAPAVADQLGDGVESEVVTEATEKKADALEESKDQTPKTKDQTPETNTKNQTPKTKEEEAKAEADAKAKAEAEKGKVEEKAKSKFAKEQERRDKSWKALNEEKAALQKQREELEAQRKEIEETARKAAEANPTYTPEQYEKYAELAEKEGKFDLAESARAEAKRLRANPPKSPDAVAQGKAFEAEVEKVWKETIGEMPEVVKKGTALNTEYMRIANDPANKAIFDSPLAPRFIAKLAKATLDASRVSALETQIKTLTERNAELQQLTELPGGGSIHQLPAAKRFEDMTMAEQEKELQRLNAEL